MTKPLRVGLIGYGFMGRTHSNAYSQVNHFFDVPYQPQLKVICGLEKNVAEAFAKRWGYESAETDWRRVIERDDIDLVDVYSCFPSAVQVAAAELGLAVADADRPLTVTGGLTFAGGPWNNYVTHSIATMAEKLVGDPGRRGLVTANGGYLTKHSFGVYSTEPPTHEFRWEDVQPAVDAEPTTPALVAWSGVGTVETWTTPFDRDGEPEKAFVAVRTPEGARTLVKIVERDHVGATVSEDIAGAKIHVNSDGTAVLV